MKSALAKKLLAGLSSPKEWVPGRYRRIGLALRRSLKAEGYDGRGKYGKAVLKKVAKKAHQLAGNNKRPSTYFYLCLQMASDLVTKDDFEVYEQHQLSWNQIRKILRAQGHCRSPEAMAALRKGIRTHLAEYGRNGFTPFIDERLPTPKKRKHQATAAR